MRKLFYHKFLAIFIAKKEKTKGQIAEEFALNFLKKEKLKLIAKNFYFRQGEIDLIMRDAKTLVFIEVRYRQSATYGSALESVTKQKQQRIIKTAQYFLLQNKKYQQSAIRFDVISLQKEISKATTLWIKSAF